MAAELRETNPNSPLGPFYLAWAAYLNQDVENAKKYLNEAVGRDPADQRAEFALAQLKENPARRSEEVFVGLTPGLVAQLAQ